FIKKDNFINEIIMLFYVNKIKIICKNMCTILAFKKNISIEFKISDMKSIDYYLDIKIIQNREKRILIFFQENYMKKTLILLKMNKIISAFTFKISDKYYETNEKKVFTEKSHKYFQFISNIMYRMIQTHSDYVFQISYLTSFF